MADWLITIGGLAAAATAAVIHAGVGVAITRWNRPLGLLLAAAAGCGIWTLTNRGLTYQFVGLQSVTTLNLYAVLCWVGFIAGSIAGLVGSVPAPSPHDSSSPRSGTLDQREITRVFDAARDSYERFRHAHRVDDLNLTETAANQARREPSLREAELQLKRVVEWCRMQKAPGLTATALGQLGTLTGTGSDFYFHTFFSDCCDGKVWGRVYYFLILRPG